ncbi:MAG TPA: DNA repair ATPase, partial [Archangium sp.]
MAETKTPAAPALGSGTYEIIRQRLQAQGAVLRERMSQLDTRRQQVFGVVESKLLQSERITTAHNCVPRDMIALGKGRFLFGFNVHLGLKKEVELEDVFGIFQRDAEDGTFKETSLDLLRDKAFVTDFKRLYQVYEKARLSKFTVVDGSLYFVFLVGTAMNDIAIFKWQYNGGQLRYVDGRSEAEFRRVAFPAQYQFKWVTPDR